jgi:hypothetical protein
LTLTRAFLDLSIIELSEKAFHEGIVVKTRFYVLKKVKKDF